MLLVKLGLVSLALAWGAAHHFLVRPRLERGAPLFAGLPRSLAGESAVGMAILLAAAVLVDSKPPVPQPAPGALDAAASARTFATNCRVLEPTAVRAERRPLVPGGQRSALVTAELAQQVAQVDDADLDVPGWPTSGSSGRSAATRRSGA